MTTRKWLQASLFAVPLALFVGLAQLPVRYWLERIVGLSAGPVFRICDRAGNCTDDGGTQGVLGWVLNHLPAIGWTVLLSATALPLLAALIRRLPRRAWMLPAAAASAWLMIAMADSPFESRASFPGGPIGEDIAVMARASGYSPDRILVGRQPPLRGGQLDARALWSNGRPYAVIDERLFNILPFSPELYRPPYRPVTAAEMRAVVGHELAHLRLGHLILLPILTVALVFLLSWLAFIGARRLLRIAGASWRVGTVTDLAAFPAFLLMFGLAFCAFVPLRNAIVLTTEQRADAVGLDIARDPDGFAALAMREARGGPMRFSPVEHWLFLNHPSPEQRISRAMAWKARNVPARWRATGLSGPVRTSFARPRMRPPDKKPSPPDGKQMVP